MLYLTEITEPLASVADVNAEIVLNNTTRRCYVWTDSPQIAKWSKGKPTLIQADDVTDKRDAYGAITIGKEVFGTNGKKLGFVTDAMFNRSLQLVKLVVDETEYGKKDVLAVGDAVIIRIAKPQRKRNTTTATTTTAQPTNTATETVTDTQQPVMTTQPVITQPLPRRKYGNFNFLLGHTVDKTVVNFQGEIMIKRGETITPQVLHEAKISGKLIELYLHLE